MFPDFNAGYDLNTGMLGTGKEGKGREKEKEKGRERRGDIKQNAAQFPLLGARGLSRDAATLLLPSLEPDFCFLSFFQHSHNLLPHLTELLMNKYFAVIVASLFGSSMI